MTDSITAPAITEESTSRGTQYWRVHGYSRLPTDWYVREHAELHHRLLSALPVVPGMFVSLERRHHQQPRMDAGKPYWRLEILVPGDPQELRMERDEPLEGPTGLAETMIGVARRHIEGSGQRTTATSTVAVVPAGRDLTRGPDGEELSWPPQYVDLVDGGTLHGWDALVPPEAGEEPITWRQLAWDIADEYGLIEDLLSRMWLHLDGEPDDEPEVSARPGVKTCEDCGRRPGQISSNFNGWVCWPCYESYEDG